MSATDLTASLFESLAWPAAAVVAVLILRRPLSDLLSSIESFKVRGTEVKLRERLTDAADRVPQSEPGPVPPSATRVTTDLIDISPRAAILEQWLEVEQSLLQLAEEHDTPIAGRSRSGKRIAQELLRAKIINDDHLFVVRQLAEVRNEVVHQHHGPIPGVVAANYVDVARRLIRTLNAATEPTRPGPRD